MRHATIDASLLPGIVQSHARSTATRARNSRVAARTCARIVPVTLSSSVPCSNLNVGIVAPLAPQRVDEAIALRYFGFQTVWPLGVARISGSQQCRRAACRCSSVRTVSGGGGGSIFWGYWGRVGSKAAMQNCRDGGAINAIQAGAASGWKGRRSGH